MPMAAQVAAAAAATNAGAAPSSTRPSIASGSSTGDGNSSLPNLRPARTRTSVAFAVDQEALASPRSAGQGGPNSTSVTRTTVNNPWALAKTTGSKAAAVPSSSGEPEAASEGDGEASTGWKVVGAGKTKASLIQLTQALRPKVFAGDKRAGGRAAALQRQLTVSQFAMVTAIALTSNSTSSTGSGKASGVSSSPGTSLLGGPRGPGGRVGAGAAAAAGGDNAAGRHTRPSLTIHTHPSAAEAAARHASQGDNQGTSSSRRPVGGFFLEPRGSTAEHWELHSECHSRPYSGFQPTRSSSPTGSWAAYTPSATGCNPGRFGWGDTQGATPGSPGRGHIGGSRSRCGSALSTFGHMGGADGVTSGTMMSPDVLQVAAGNASSAAAAAASGTAAGSLERGTLKHTCGSFTSDSECPSCAAMAVARRAAVDAGRSSWSGDVDRNWAHIPAVIGVDTAAAVAAHAAAADLEAAQATLLRRLLGTYALKAYKDAMKGRKGPSASALARLPTPSADDIEHALRAAAAEEAAAAHAAAAARNSVQTGATGQTTPGVTSSGGGVKAGACAAAGSPGGCSVLPASPGDTPGVAGVPGAATSSSGASGSSAGTLGRLNSTSTSTQSTAASFRSQQQPGSGTDGSTVVPLVDLAAELAGSPRLKDSQLKQLVQQLTPRGSQCPSTGAETLVLAHQAGAGDSGRSPAFYLGSKQKMQQQHQEEAANSSSSPGSSCGGATSSRGTAPSRLSGHPLSPAMGLTGSQTLTREDKFDLAAAAATLATACGSDSLGVQNEAAVRPRDKGTWSTTPRQVGSTSIPPLVNRGLTSPQLRSPSSMAGPSTPGASGIGVNSSGSRDVLTSMVNHTGPDVAETARAAAVTAAVAGLDETEADMLTGLLTGRLTSRTGRMQQERELGQQQGQASLVKGQTVHGYGPDGKLVTPRPISYTMQYSPRSAAVQAAAGDHAEGAAAGGGKAGSGGCRSCSRLTNPSPSPETTCAQPELGLSPGQQLLGPSPGAREDHTATAGTAAAAAGGGGGGGGATAASPAAAAAAAGVTSKSTAGKLGDNGHQPFTDVTSGTSVASRAKVLGATGKGWSPSTTPRGAYQSMVQL